MMEKKTRVLPETRDVHAYEHYLSTKEVEYGGMLAISVVFVQALLSYTAIDGWITFAFYGFAVGIPFLACPLVAKTYYRRITKWTRYGGEAGLVSSATSIVMVFFHFSLPIGWTFFAAICVTFLVARRGY